MTHVQLSITHLMIALSIHILKFASFHVMSSPLTSPNASPRSPSSTAGTVK
jgi:hypothetical protein